jgi:spore maturation protein CgeB
MVNTILFKFKKNMAIEKIKLIVNYFKMFWSRVWEKLKAIISKTNP